MAVSDADHATARALVGRNLLPLNGLSRAVERAIPAAVIYPLGLALGVLLSVTIFPFSALVPVLANDPTAANDAAQHIVGQRYFIADTWHWPLLNTHLLAGPVGTNIALTDSIPLMALLAKSVRGILPPGFHTIYLWLAIAYTLQPAAAIFALRSTGQRGLLPCLAAACIAASMPVWFARVGHAALSGHFLILLALGLSWRISGGVDARQRLRIIGLATALLVSSLLIHPYLMVMTAALLGAAPISLLLRGDRNGWMAALGVGFGMALTALAAMVLGYASAQGAVGFGVYAMNLLSPVFPLWSTLFPHLEPLPTPSGNIFEGYNYLGAGALVLAVAAIASLFHRGQVRALARNGGLILVCLALTLFALSNHIYLGARQVANLGPVPDMLQEFRASGRFFWPVAYVIVIAGIAALARLGRPWWVGGLLMIATMLQVTDAGLLRSEARRVMNQKDDWGVEADRLRPLIATHRFLTVLPVYGCGPNYGDQLTQLLLLASEYLIPVNTMYVARWESYAACSDTTAHSALRDGELRILYPVEAGQMVPDAARLCRPSAEFAVCSLQADQIRKLLPSFDPGPVVQTAQPMRSPGSVLVSGWYDPEEDGTWSHGNAAKLAATIDKPALGPLRLTVWAAAIAPTAGGRQTITVDVDGTQVAVWSMHDLQSTELHADIPAGLVSKDTLLITFRIADPVRPVDRGMDPDARLLGLALAAFRIDAAR